jgi:anti-anti-sigma factor
MLTIEPVVDGTGGGAGVCVVRIRGSADIHSEEQMEKVLGKIADVEPRLVVLDLEGVDILTSLAIGVLVGFRSRIVSHGGRVVMAQVPELIAKTMRFTRVSELFVRYGSVADAAASKDSAKR